MGAKITYTHDELVAQLKARNQKAFTYLYDNYYQALFGIIDALINNQEESEDLLQNAFLKIWNSFDSYDPEKGRLYTWMLRVARNIAIDFKRSKQDKINHKIHVPVDSVYNKNVLFVEDNRHETIGLLNVVNNLDEDQLRVIELAYYQGYTQNEISEKLNLPLGSVKSKVRQAILKLRDLTKEKMK